MSGGEGHQQTRHQREYNEDTEEYRLAEYDTEVKAELELHEHHRDHTGKGGKAGRRYLRDSLTERRYDRVAGAHGGSFFRVSVAEDYRVVGWRARAEELPRWSLKRRRSRRT